MIRRAQFADVPRIVEILQQSFVHSPYAGGPGQIDVKEAKGLLVNCIQRHGGKNVGATFVEVAERFGVVEGFIVGLLQRVLHIGTHLQATDLFWLATPQVEPRDPSRLMRNMVAWALQSPGVIEIRVGATNDAGTDWLRAEKLLLKRGFVPCGGIYKQEVKR
jgi:hypothetical protein